MLYAKEHGFDIPEKVFHLLQSIKEQSIYIEELINSFLNVSMIENNGYLVISVSYVDIVQITLRVINRFTGELNKSNIPIEFHGDNSIHGWWDPLRLEQAISNLIYNAIKYAADRPVKIIIKKETDHIIWKIQDHGVGIAEADQCRIFEKFFRGGSENFFNGLGLGLWIVKQIIEAHGGTITVKSQPSRGSEFIFQIPIGRRASDKVSK
jgi:signal transduction histidine kinase